MAFRNTISGAFTSLLTHLEEIEGQSGDSDQDLRKVAAGEGGITEHPIPFLVIRASKATVTGHVEGDKTWAVEIKFRIVAQITKVSESQTEILNRIAQVEDQIDTWVRPKGVSGLEEGEWSTSPAQSSEGGNLVVADAIQTLTVVVTRGAN